MPLYNFVPEYAPGHRPHRLAQYLLSIDRPNFIERTTNSMATKPNPVSAPVPDGGEILNAPNVPHGPYLTLQVPPAYFRRITLPEAQAAAARIIACDPNQDVATQYFLTATDPNDAGRSIFYLSAPTRQHNQSTDRFRIDVGFWITEALNWGDNWQKETTAILSQYLRVVDSNQ